MSYSSAGNHNELAKPILGTSDDGATFDYLEKDPYSGCLGSIDSAHLRVHKGQAYTASYYDAALADTTSISILFTTDSTTYPHIITSVSSSGNASVLFYEGATTSNDGTAVVTINRNRNSSNVNGLTVTHTPTVTTNGTLIYEDYIPAGEKSKATGGSDGWGDELVLKPSTKYLLVLTNDSGASAIVSVSAGWYENA